MDHKKIVFLFSGQGSQFRGMGKSLFENHTVFANSIQRSDSFLKQELGWSLINELYKKSDKTFDDILITHPAIVAVEIAILEVFQSHGIVADYALGNSLGEFTAAIAKGIWSPRTALEASIKQSICLSKKTKMGGMLAIIEKVEKISDKYLQKYPLEIAAFNFPGHFTVAGRNDTLSALEEELRKTKVQYFRLPVQYPFHSSLIQDAAAEFITYINRIEISKVPHSGWISGLYGGEIEYISPDYFWKVVRCPIKFSRAVSFIEQKGSCIYIDLGPSGTAATFVKYNLSKSSTSKTLSIMTPFKTGYKMLNRAISEIQIMGISPLTH